MFSVVIPLYNKAYGIERALKSVINQKGKFIYEVIIVNDGSTDESGQVAEKFIDNHIKVIHQRNSGVSVARNIGIKCSQYETICFLDADDWWEPNYFNTLHNLIVEFPHECFFLMGYKKISNIDQTVVKLSNKPKIFEKFGSTFLNTKGLVTPSIAVKKVILFKMGLFPEGITISEDLLLWSKIISRYRVVYTPIVVSNIWYEEDDSRQNRGSKVPYVLVYYAKNENSSKNIKGFLLYIYIAHLYQSIIFEDIESWRKRWVVGLKLFPIYAILAYFSILFFWIKNVFK